jgi:sigma-B regulation protein RsbU (phosphoserine phosphatase)
MAIIVSAGCVILDLGEGEHMKKNGSIRQQVQRLLFLCSVVSLLLLGGIALLGMMGARENSRQSGYEMGEEVRLRL